MKYQAMDSNRMKSHNYSVRKSIFTWVICAILGWTLAITSLNNLFLNENETVIAENEPSAEDAARMDQILPAAGSNKE